MLATAAAMALSACTTVPQSTANETASAPSPAPVAGEAFERDRQAILAMVGNFDVRFDFIETVALAEGYELKDRKLSGAYEVVRVVEDTGDFISLQHTLVIGEGDDAFPLKHWRQDWTYEPEKVLSFIGGNAWTVTDVPADERRGAWSQEVYQVDDSPRYGGVGRWTYEDGVPTWEAKRAWRPLPRRDMTTRDDYHAVDAVNRHAITPDGWVHEQDNTKVVLTTGEAEALVREVAVNTYKRSDAFDASIVDKRLAKTQDYWEGVKAAWEAFETAGEPFALTLKGEPEALYQPLLALGSEVADGERSTESAISEAREIIGTYTTLDLPPLTERLR
mgnify:CR=1 FL=1